jgi:tetratricopeptide (TPR) repeat protein
LKLFTAISVFGLVAAGCAAGQTQPLTLRVKAKFDFDKVDASPIPDIATTQACVQSNAAALLVTKPTERYLIYYQKGYCELFEALIDGASETFQAAAKDFTEAMVNWPKKPAAPPPGAVKGLILIAHLEQGRMANSYPDMERELGELVKEPECIASPVMAKAFCAAVIDTARAWLGWLAYNKIDFAAAANALEPLTRGTMVTPWATWLQGRLAQQQNRVEDAVALYEKTLAAWTAVAASAQPDVMTLLGPRVDIGAVHYQLGVADYSRRQYDSAITHLDASLNAHPRNSYAVFLRARSKDALHLNKPAMADYALATQMARVDNDSSWNVAQAHYYRGLLLYEAKDYPGADAEFAPALSGRLGEIGKPDVAAWKAMAATAGGGCEAIDQLETAAAAASSQFPKAVATAIVFDCRVKQATTLDQYIALDKLYENRLDKAKLRELKNLIASGYADQGIAFEDQKDPYSAVGAYRKAIEWNPGNSKARFNLGAIYIEDKRYELAEKEYRALVEADANDFEAHYWLAASILAQHPAPERVAAACALLQKSLSISDPEKKAQFQKSLVAANCAK